MIKGRGTEAPRSQRLRGRAVVQYLERAHNAAFSMAIGAWSTRPLPFPEGATSASVLLKTFVRDVKSSGLLDRITRDAGLRSAVKAEAK
jgi:hypothetical protein